MTENATRGKEADASTKTELRAEWEGFEYRVPAPGRVRVENVSYGEESADHVYVVEVAEHVGATACTCPADEYNADPCKHRIGVENTEPVMQAATDGLSGAYPVADGGEDSHESHESDGDETDEDDDTSRKTPVRSEPADFGGGEGGMDEL